MDRGTVLITFGNKIRREHELIINKYDGLLLENGMFFTINMNL